MFFLHSLNVAVSLVTTLCYQIPMPFTLELPQICPEEKTSREVQACGYPYVQIIMDKATVSVSILFPNTSCYETVVLIAANFIRFFRIMYGLPASILKILADVVTLCCPFSKSLVNCYWKVILYIFFEEWKLQGVWSGKSCISFISVKEQCFKREWI